MSFQPPKGTNDLLAPRSQAWRQALRRWEEMSERFGYPLVMTPVFEATELFERGVGDTTEVVTKQMYTFTDKGGRSVTLRPEGTAGVVRAFLDSGHQGAWKGAYSGPFFRYERPQAGRRRQFWQVGVEFLDVKSPYADAEVVELGYSYIQELGLAEITLLLNSLGDSRCRPGYVEALTSYLRSKESQLSEDAVGLIGINPLRVLDSTTDQVVLAGAPRTVDHLCEPCAEHYEGVKAALKGLGLPYTEDPGLVRGLDYYTRTAFEYVATGLDAAQNAVGGGGRYDGLAEAIGGRAVPGVGLALGLDRVMLALGEPEMPYLDAYLVTETDPDEALLVASRLRREGIRVDFDTEGRSVEAQFRTARRLDVPVVLVWRGEGQPVGVRWVEGKADLPLDEVADWFEAGSR